MEERISDRPPIVTVERRRQRSAWWYVFGVVLIAYSVAFGAVIWIGAGYDKASGTPTPMTVALTTLLATTNPAVLAQPTLPPTPTVPPPTATPAPPTPTAIPSTPTVNPNAEFRVPLSASNTGTFQGQRIAIMNITDDARPGTGNARPATGSKFLTVEVLIENLSDAPVSLGKWQVHTSTNADVAATAVNGFTDALPTSTTIAPRASIHGVVIFTVPTSAKITWIQYLPNPAFRGALYFDT